jgi:hypothetical protein
MASKLNLSADEKKEEVYDRDYEDRSMDEEYFDDFDEFKILDYELPASFLEDNHPRWVRSKIAGDDDLSNLTKAQRRGWRIFVDPRSNEPVVRGSSTLMYRPKHLQDRRRKHIENLNARYLDSLIGQKNSTLPQGRGMTKLEVDESEAGVHYEKIGGSSRVARIN